MSQSNIIVVSGLPRSGTSLMMQLLGAGGVPLLTDNLRKADLDNPNGYFEYQQVKRLNVDSSWMGLAQGRAIKIVSPLLTYLPVQWQYKIIFMERDLGEVIASQDKMLSNLATAKHMSTDAQCALLCTKFANHLAQVKSGLATKANCAVHYLALRDLLINPVAQAQALGAFLQLPFDAHGGAAVVNPALYRNRTL